MGFKHKVRFLRLLFGDYFEYYECDSGRLLAKDSALFKSASF